MSLAPLFPEKLILGIEIRDKVVDIVRKRIADLRATPAVAESTESSASADVAGTPPFSNISVLRSNAMKHLINY